MEEFKSVNALVWWLQNNGGGRVEILATTDTSNTAVTICVTLDRADAVTGQGRFLKAALEAVNENL